LRKELFSFLVLRLGYKPIEISIVERDKAMIRKELMIIKSLELIKSLESLESLESELKLKK
jgi:hypothetical protein